jgi:hypothetical protein
VWWVAALAAVAFVFSLGFLAGTVVARRRHARTLEAVLTRDLAAAGLLPGGEADTTVRAE